MFFFLSFWALLSKQQHINPYILTSFIFSHFFLLLPKDFLKLKILCVCSVLLKIKPHIQPLHTVLIIEHKDLLISTQAPVFKFKDYTLADTSGVCIYSISSLLTSVYTTVLSPLHLATLKAFHYFQFQLPLTSYKRCAFLLPYSACEFQEEKEDK